MKVLQSKKCRHKRVFFDRHSTVIVFVLNALPLSFLLFELFLLGGFFTNFLLFLGKVIVLKFFLFACCLMFILSVSFVFSNFHRKRKEVLRGLLYYFIFLASIGFIGLGTCVFGVLTSGI
jgi:putative copper export protein